MTDNTKDQLVEDNHDNKDIAEMSFEEAREALEKLVDEMQDGTLPLDLVVHLTKRGELLAEHCEKLLTKAKQTIGGNEQAF